MYRRVYEQRVRILFAVAVEDTCLSAIPPVSAICLWKRARFPIPRIQHADKIWQENTYVAVL
jgi:hypothetical protein